MQNKTLNRVLRKTIGTTTLEELASAFADVRAASCAEDCGTRAAELSAKIAEALEQIDVALTDQDRVLEIRDRSLTVSSKEMTSLADELAEAGKKNSSTLDELRQILRALSSRSVERDDGDDLAAIVSQVKHLVARQAQAVSDLKKLFEEGLKISSVRNFADLERQANKSIGKVLDVDARVRMYFSSQVLGEDGPLRFHGVDADGNLTEPFQMDANAGADAFVNISSPTGKGVLAMLNLGERSASEIERVQPLIPSVAATLENIRLLQDERRKQQMQAELATASFVQQTLLPVASPAVADGSLDIGGFYASADECGGDWWTYFAPPDGKHVVIVGDVTGHGMASAMVTAVVKGYCDSFANREGLSPGQMLRELNRVVHRFQTNAGRAMTMVIAAIDPYKQSLTIANAGHPPPLRLRGDASQPEARKSQFLTLPGPILGYAPESDYAERNFPFASGEALVFYTDGLTERLNRNGEMYGERRMSRVLSAPKSAASSSGAVRAIWKDADDFAVGYPLKDDVTIVIVRNLVQPGAKLSVGA